MGPTSPQATAGPLAGLRVVELAGIGPAPYCVMLLADFGADVVRIERPGQPIDRAGPVVGRGRRSLSVDLKVDQGALLEVIDRADVLIDPYRPGVAERLGIGPKVCCSRNPRLVYGRMTGWGQSGPWAQTAGHDICYIALTGVLFAVGDAGGPPQIPLNLLGDYAGGSMFLLGGILAALLERSRSGLGQVVDSAIVDGAASLSSYIVGMLGQGRWSQERGANRLDGGAPFYSVYETADHEWMAMGAIEPRFYAEAIRLLELSDTPAQDDERRWPELRDLLAQRFRQRTRAEWSSIFYGTDACVTPVLRFGEAAVHPHIAARGTMVESDGTLSPAGAPRLSRSAVAHAQPEIPAVVDVDEVLASWSAANGWLNVQ